MFVEIELPTLLEGVTGAQELEMTISARSSEYEASGFVGSSVVGNDPGEPSTTEIGIRWKPIDDVLVRATFGETFRAPSVDDIYSEVVVSLSPQALDPCNTDQFPGQDAATQANCLAAGVPEVVLSNQQLS